MVDTSASFTASANTSSAVAMNGITTVDDIILALSTMRLKAGVAETVLNAVLEATEDIGNDVDPDASVASGSPDPPSLEATSSLASTVVATPAPAIPTVPAPPSNPSTAPTPGPAAAVPSSPATAAIPPSPLSDDSSPFVYGTGAILFAPDIQAPSVWHQRYNGFDYEVPRPNSKGPFYCVTKGTRLGIFAGWQTTSPLMTGISHAVHSRVDTIAEGVQIFHEAFDDGAVQCL
ncbi:hypothetical protein BV22DRAFT_1133938 [Leucogyrophana mollusca]|uniref:Uncharacterized protein n=1 Tax=Leucogyrophana mollusca TaxID=85980 RepID=A0ACB8B0I3_9AGAM|nr:hypothetical protein BV22DRAFT_1133938 [Leucogyrophana mollusca]